MKPYIFALPLSLVAVGTFFPTPALSEQSKEYANAQLIVSAARLDGLIKSKSTELVVIDVRTAQKFATGHIPGARRLGPNAVVDQGASVDGALLPTKLIADLLGRLGVSAKTEVVLYDDKGGFHASRVFWLLEYYGHRKVRILDGGLRAWKAAGLELSTSREKVGTTKRFAPTLTPRRHATADWIMERRNDPEAVVIDVRPKALFEKGHIPWARNIPWKGNLAADGTMKSGKALKLHFARHGVTLDSNVVVHCKNGLASSHSYYALRLLGYPRVRTYHRSWAEWGASDDLPKAKDRRG